MEKQRQIQAAIRCGSYFKTYSTVQINVVVLRHLVCFFVRRDILLAAFVGIAFCCCVEQCYRKHSHESE